MPLKFLISSNIIRISNDALILLKIINIAVDRKIYANRSQRSSPEEKIRGAARMCAGWGDNKIIDKIIDSNLVLEHNFFEFKRLQSKIFEENYDEASALFSSADRYLL